jgi:UDP-N-acetyl-2-amino-2-deoxyglucuronate dehydrogenase
MLIWIFGNVEHQEVHFAAPTKTAGYLELEHARIKWFLSIDNTDLPSSCFEKRQTTFRSITGDGKEVEFSEGFTDLHTKVYEEILAGRGFGPEDSRPSINLAHDIRTAAPVGVCANSHPMLPKVLGK